jgi:anthranilate phosphoribosyltransferase
MRKSIGVRTFFNLLGPLANPAVARRQLIGTWSNEKARLMARTLALLEAEHAMVVHASDSLDEITLTGPTYVAEVANGSVREFTLTPEDFGFAPHTAAEPYAGADTAAGNAAILANLFHHPADARREHREIVLANTAAVLVVAGLAGHWLDGVALAQTTLDSGAAAAHLERLQGERHA